MADTKSSPAFTRAVCVDDLVTLDPEVRDWIEKLADERLKIVNARCMMNQAAFMVASRHGIVIPKTNTIEEKK